MQIPGPNGSSITPKIAGWVLRGWINQQVAAATRRLPPAYQANASYWWRNNRSVDALAHEIGRDARWLVVQTSWQLSSPTDQQVLELATSLIGGVRADEIQLLADAIIIAGAPKNSEQRKQAEYHAARALGGIAFRSVLYDL